MNEHPYGHPFQLNAWGELKATTGWQSHLLGYYDQQQLVAGAHMLTLPLPGVRKKIAYIPRGPVIDPEHPQRDNVLSDLVAFAASLGAFYLKIEPQWRHAALPDGWQHSRETILHQETVATSLTADDEESLLASISKNSRYLARRALREGVELVDVTDANTIDAVYEVYKETARRAGFELHPLDYYQTCFRLLGDSNLVLLAYRESRPVAFLWGVYTKQTGIYLYGGSNDEGRDSLANYALQMELIQRLYRLGVVWYDLNGLVTSGVTSFKEKFAHEHITWIGSYDYPINAGLYQTWYSFGTRLRPVVRSLKRLLYRSGLGA